MAPALHPVEHRGYRELYAAGRQLLRRWPKLADALADTDCGPALDNGALRVRELLEEAQPRIESYDLHLGPAAGSIGAGVGSVRAAVVDRSLDSGVAARLAVLDIEHLATLLAQLAAVAAARGDEGLATFSGGWAKRLRAEVKSVRRAAVSLGLDPDRAAEPLDHSPVGQLAHRAGWALGTFGEWLDRQTSRG